MSERNREIREKNKQLEQMQARLTRLNAWAQYEKKMDEELITQGEDVSNLYLRYVLASRIFESTVPPNRKDRRLEDATGLMVVMSDYNIADAASYAEAVKQANAKFYDLRSRRKENAELSSAIGARIHAYEDRKKYQRYYNAWSKLSGSKASAYEREHGFELHKYRQADEALNRWEADGERIDCKGWQVAMKHLNKERFLLDYELQGQKETKRILEQNNLRIIRLHDLRHTCASLLLANGVPMKQIQEWLGHSDFSTTANIYAHLDYHSKLSSAEAMLTGLGLAHPNPENG